MFFELVSILFAIVPDYGNEYKIKKNWTSFKNFAPKLNLNHNIYNRRQTTSPGTTYPTLYDKWVGSFTSHRIINIEGLWDRTYGLIVLIRED